jgi:hypothetical protein
MSWLQRSHPELVEPYRQLFGRGAYLPESYRDMLRDRAAPLLTRYGLTSGHRSFRLGPAAPPPAAPAPQPTLF